MFRTFQRLKSGIMSDMQGNDQEAAFVRFLSIIYQVISDELFDGKLNFRQCVTLKKLSIYGVVISDRILMDTLIVPDLTVVDAITNSLMVDLQKGIWDLE